MSSYSETDVAKAQRILADELFRSGPPPGSGAQRFSYLNEQLTAPQFFYREPVVGVGVTADSSGQVSLAVLSSGSTEPMDLNAMLRRLSIADVPLRVLPVGLVRAAGRPAKGGSHIQMQKGPDGTLGCLVRDQSGGDFILSCNHVLAACGSGFPNATVIEEPAFSGLRFGVLSQSVAIQFSSGTSNTMDAALATPDGGAAASGLNNGTKINGYSASPAYNVQVTKEGAATGTTSGILTIKNLSILVKLCGQQAVFDQQYGIVGAVQSGILGTIGLKQGRFADHGDSGSIVLDGNNSAIGMVFAVSSRIDLAYCNPIEPILNHFSVKIV